MNDYPVRVRGDLAAPPGRWLWLVKWLLLIPHIVVLIALWIVFLAFTLAAYVVVLVTGRYPASIFAFNVGVLRWTWRVGYYGYQVLGTDRYPPFALREEPDYPAGLDIAPPGPVPRWRPLVAWLLAFPHLLILAAFAGGNWQTSSNGDTRMSWPGLVTVVLLIAAIALLFTARYPRGLYDLLVGLSRWGLRVVAYVALLSDAYPPFRLDQGAREPGDRSSPDPTGSGMPGR